VSSPARATFPVSKPTGRLRRSDRVTLGALLAPAPPTNFSDARAIRGTSQKLQPRPSLGFFRVARAPLYRSCTDRECDTLQQLTVKSTSPPSSIHCSYRNFTVMRVPQAPDLLGRPCTH